MTYTQQVVVYDHGKPTEHHQFPVPSETDPGGYKTLLSLNAFRKREARRLSDLQQTLRAGKPTQVPPRRVAFLDEPRLGITLPTFTHKSLWDFYEAIGYDYKRKRYEYLPPCFDEATWDKAATAFFTRVEVTREGAIRDWRNGMLAALRVLNSSLKESI